MNGKWKRETEKEKDKAGRITFTVEHNKKVHCGGGMN